LVVFFERNLKWCGQGFETAPDVAWGAAADKLVMKFAAVQHSPLLWKTASCSLDTDLTILFGQSMQDHSWIDVDTNGCNVLTSAVVNNRLAVSGTVYMPLMTISFSTCTALPKRCKLQPSIPDWLHLSSFINARSYICIASTV
jgi:hypothetical protein